MIFRFTPVVLFFFFSALLAISVFLLTTSYRNAQDALEFEQLEQISRSHDVAQQFFDFRLVEARRAMESIATFAEDGNGKLLPRGTLRNTILDYVIRYEAQNDNDLDLREIYGNPAADATGVIQVFDKWVLRDSASGPTLVYQFKNFIPAGEGVYRSRIFKGGINLKNNFSLLNALRGASHAFAHYLVYENTVLGVSESLEEGVQETASEVLREREPVFADFTKVFSGDILPLRIDNAANGLSLLSVITTQGSQNWKESFKQTILYGLFIVLIISISVTFLLNSITHQSLDRLLQYAKMVRAGHKDAHYQSGTIHEFNTVGNVIEEMVDDLSEQAQYISEMMQAGNSPIMAWDQNGKIRVINSAMQKMFEMDERDSIQTIDQFFQKYNDPIARRACEDALRGKTINFLETKSTVGDRTFYLIWSITPLRDTNDQISGVIAQGQDVTEHRLAEGNLRLSSTVFANASEGIIITDQNAKIIDVNTAFTDITGYTREEVIGHNPSIMKSGRHSNSFYLEMWQELQDRGSWRGEIWDKRKNGDIFPKWLSINACRDEHGRLTHYVAVFSDITAKKADEEKLEQLAHFDHLTGLPNRILFQDRLKGALARSRRDKENMAVLFVDLDRFKQINDTLGHRVGDLLLKEVSNRLIHSVREIDTVSRLSGDEFTVILTDLASIDDVEMVASRIVKSLGAPYFFEGHELFVSASVGISIYPTDGKTSTDLLRNADVAMYYAKEKGRNNYQFFDPRMNEKAQSQLSMANQLRIALNRKLIHPHYQLKVDTALGKPVGLEALARWNDDRGKPISPGLFIPVAEEHGLIGRVGSSILSQVCVQIRQWRDMDVEFGSVAVNLSAQQFRDPNLLREIKEAIEDNHINPQNLQVEVTENMVMDDVEDAIRILNNLKEMGLKISIDDFGTGYSSLNYLKRFPVDTLKIDRTFIHELAIGNDDAAIVSAIVSMAQNLGIDLVAEGVEEQEQVDFLRSIGCNVVQGFFYAKPCAGGEVPLVWNQVLDRF